MVAAVEPPLRALEEEEAVSHPQPALPHAHPVVVVALPHAHPVVVVALPLDQLQCPHPWRPR